MKRRRPDEELSDAALGTTNLTKSEIQRMVTQEVQQAVERSEKTMQSLLERIQELNAEAEPSSRIVKLEAQIKKLKRRGDTVFTYVQDHGGPNLFPKQGSLSPDSEMRSINSSRASSTDRSSTPAAETDGDGSGVRSLKHSKTEAVDLKDDIVCRLNGVRNTDSPLVAVSIKKEQEEEQVSSCDQAAGLTMDSAEKETEEESQHSKTEAVDLKDDIVCRLNGVRNTDSPLVAVSIKKEQEEEQVSSCDQAAGLTMDSAEKETEEESQAALRARLPPFPDTPFPDQLPLTAATKSLPPKPVVKVARITQPRSIALLWNAEQTDPHVPDMDSYHLYVAQQQRSGGVVSRWRSMGAIKAMPLPMACRVADRSAASTLFFIIVGKDIYGRYGPYSDVQAIHGSDDNCNNT